MARSFSAPGKALLAGGYLVLDKQFKSYVVALSARMHAVISGAEVDGLEHTVITIKSPQFAQGEWRYSINDDNGGLDIVEANGRVNPFAQLSVQTVLAYVASSPNQQRKSKSEIEITIYSDSSYHTVENTVKKTHGAKVFHYHSDEITKIAKTGLGSSAGLVTVLTTALLSYYEPSVDLEDPKTLQLIHNLAQVAHCQAQGKIGSGFDVAAATFGSITYRRFDPKLISELKPLAECSTLEEYHNSLKSLVESRDWDIHMVPVALPHGVKLLMGDIRGGSNTPKLVSKVLKWRETDPRSASVYEGIDRANMTLVDCLSSLNTMFREHPESYKALLHELSSLNSHEIAGLNKPSFSLLHRLIGSNSTIRHNMRYITRESGAEIEPQQQTALLDSCLQIPGVLAAVVPGAGGYDAICLLVIEESLDAFYRLTRNDPKFSNVTWMDLREEARGIVEEDALDYGH